MTPNITLTLPDPEVEILFAALEMSSATKEVATLRRGILNNFDIMLKIDMETPADANSTGPTDTEQSLEILKW